MNETVKNLWVLPLASALCAAAAGIGLSACAAHDEEPGSAEANPVAAESEAYSDGECQAAAADRQGTYDEPLNYTDTSPTTYGKSSAFKSFIWDLTPRSLIPNVYTDLRLGSIAASAYDTQAECTALTLRRRLYVKLSTVGAFQLYADADVRGQWDTDFGCTLPRQFGPDLTCGHATQGSDGTLHCDDGLGPTMTVRVCVTARDGTDATLPVSLHVTQLNHRIGDVFNNPQVKVGSFWRPVLADSTSAAAYCARRFDGAASFSNGAAVYPYAQFVTSFHGWFVPTAFQNPEPVIQQLVCALPISH